MRKPSKNLTGMRFGRLTILRQLEERKSGHIVYECLCDCGNTTIVHHRSLITGSTKSCGCLHKEIMSNIKSKDLTGQRFGRLIAVKPTEQRESTYVLWECICDCGNTTFATANNLQRGMKQSCGCLRTELHSKDLTGQRFGTVVVVAPTKQRMRRYIVWECQCDCGKVRYIPSHTLKRLGAKLCDCADSAKL